MRTLILVGAAIVGMGAAVPAVKLAYANPAQPRADGAAAQPAPAPHLQQAEALAPNGRPPVTRHRHLTWRRIQNRVTPIQGILPNGIRENGYN